MTNKILIDGWNVAWRMEDLRGLIPDELQKARTILNTRIRSYFAGKKAQYKIIYDGKPGISGEDHYVRGIDIRFSKSPENADQLIIRFITGQKNKREWTLVTSDRGLQAHATSLGASVLDSDLFIQRITSVQADIPNQYKHDPKLDQQEMNYWMDMFSSGKKEHPDK